MTRLEKLQKAVEILMESDKVQRKCNCRTIYDNIEIDTKNLKITVVSLIFKSELDKIDYIYIHSEDNKTTIYF